MSQPNDQSSLPLVVENLHKRFRQEGVDIPALNGVSLAVPDGDFVAIMGPSGSGKSTLLHVIAGLTNATSGQVRIHGMDIATLSDRRMTALRRRQIGVVFQAFNLIPTLSVQDNITLPVQADGRACDLGRLLRITSLLGIDDKLDRRPGKLSGGEQQRVAIARALLPAPAIILADEPTGSLDSEAGQNLCRLLRTCCEQEKQTILLVTHEPSVAAWARQTLVLKDGRLVGKIPSSDQNDAQALAAAYQSIIQA